MAITETEVIVGHIRTVQRSSYRCAPCPRRRRYAAAPPRIQDCRGTGLAAMSVALGLVLAPSLSRSEGVRVDDEQVLPVGQIRAGIGFGAAHMAAARAVGQQYSTVGTGLNLEGALGCGYRLETGLRVGLRLDEPGRGVRADEMARGFERETLGTGLSSVANPEGRLRWGAMQDGRWEMGLEYRLVIPIASDTDVTNVLSPWLTIHGQHVWRIDLALDGAVAARRFAAGWVPQTAIGGSARIWINIAQSIFTGLFGAVHAFASTPYTAGYETGVVGIGIGGRWGPCDSLLLIRSDDPTRGGTSRVGAGIMFECRFATL